MSVSHIAKLFDVSGQVVSTEPLGAGNINDTYLVNLDNEVQFVLQKINKVVFPEPEAVMSNIQLVTGFASRELSAEQTASGRNWQVPQVVESRDGNLYVIDQDGEYWRGLTLVTNTQAYEMVETPNVAFEAGKVLGWFQRIIADCPIDDLKDTLPGFHIAPQYLADYDLGITSAIAQERLADSQEAQRLGDLISRNRETVSTLEDAKNRGELTLRPIHGDPKITNILFDQDTNLGTSIIDLDTVKPGLIHYDFGDAVRSACNRAGEETSSLSSVAFDIELFTEFCSGYLSEANQFLTQFDRTYLYDSIEVLTFELGLRFYADYITGDHYFKTSYRGQNLNRAAVQFALYESIVEQKGDIQQILTNS